MNVSEATIPTGLAGETAEPDDHEEDVEHHRLAGPEVVAGR